MQLHADLLIVEDFVSMPLLKLPAKMTLVRIGQDVILISPLPGFKSFLEQVKTFGMVTHIVAPNLFHNLGIGSALECFPEAKLWGSEAFKRAHPSFPWQESFSEKSWPFQKELSLFQIEGMPKVNESTFIHRASKTLIVTDLCFNHVQGSGPGYWLMFNIFGTYKKFGVSRLFAMMIKDKSAFKKSIAALLAQQFESIIVPHGLNIDRDGNERLKEALKSRNLI